MCNKKGEYDKAIEEFSLAIAADPNFAPAHYVRGITYGRKGHFDRETEDYSKAMAIDPGFSWTRFHRGVSYLQLGKQGAAIVDMQEAARMGNREAQSWLRERRGQKDFTRSHQGG